MRLTNKLWNILCKPIHRVPTTHRIKINPHTQSQNSLQKMPQKPVPECCGNGCKNCVLNDTQYHV